MKIKMCLLSDMIFGSGLSLPGGVDILIQTDEHGFPFYKGSTFKGVFREALEQYLAWTDPDDKKKSEKTLKTLLGIGGDKQINNPRKLIFSDFVLSMNVRGAVLDEGLSQVAVRELFTNSRTFTKVQDEGTVADGSLRTAHCINKNLWFYSEIACAAEDEELIEDVLGTIKWIGTMRNRGFGNVLIEREEER